MVAVENIIFILESSNVLFFLNQNIYFDRNYVDRTWFNVILEEADEEFVAELLTVLIERSGVIYGIPEYKHDVERLVPFKTSVCNIILNEGMDHTAVSSVDGKVRFLIIQSTL